MDLEQIGLWAGFVLTLMVFSYIFGDNVLYRLAVYVFAGLTAGFVAVITYDSVLVPWWNSTLGPGIETQNISGIVFGALPLVFGALLLLKPVRGFGWPGSMVLALLIGVGAAVALVGAVSGTLIPLTVETGQSISAGLVPGLISIVGVITTLVYFQYGASRGRDEQIRQNVLLRFLRSIGGAFLAFTLGSVYGAAIVTSLTVFSERVAFMVSFVAGLIGG